jgi:hypothetical protein
MPAATRITAVPASGMMCRNLPYGMARRLILPTPAEITARHDYRQIVERRHDRLSRMVQEQVLHDSDSDNGSADAEHQLTDGFCWCAHGFHPALQRLARRL